MKVSSVVMMNTAVLGIKQTYFNCARLIYIETIDPKHCLDAMIMIILYEL